MEDIFWLSSYLDSSLAVGSRESPIALLISAASYEVTYSVLSGRFSLVSIIISSSDESLLADMSSWLEKKE